MPIIRTIGVLSRRNWKLREHLLSRVSISAADETRSRQRLAIRGRRGQQLHTVEHRTQSPERLTRQGQESQRMETWEGQGVRGQNVGTQEGSPTGGEMKKEK